MHIHNQDVLDRAIEVQGDVPGARAGHAMVSSGRMLYVFGGVTAMQVTEPDRYQYDGKNSQAIPLRWAPALLPALLLLLLDGGPACFCQAATNGIEWQART